MQQKHKQVKSVLQHLRWHLVMLSLATVQMHEHVNIWLEYMARIYAFNISLLGHTCCRWNFLHIIQANGRSLLNGSVITLQTTSRLAGHDLGLSCETQNECSICNTAKKSVMVVSPERGKKAKGLGTVARAAC